VCFTLFLGALLTVCAISGCKNTPENHKILSFFFDGVPDPTEEKKSAAGEGETGGTGSTGPEPSTHKPVVDRLCGDCHGASRETFRKRGFTGIDISSITMAWETCRDCHSNSDKVPEASVIVRSDRWLHGPVAAGRCQDCHRGHRSEYPHLLRSGNLEAACRSCHEQLPERSGAMAEMRCVECHDPHSAARGSDLLLRGGRSRSCGRCHELDKETRPWMHGPVAKGVCQACHSGHGGTGHENHTLQPVSDACLHCHNFTETCAPASTPEGPADCIECHDPHSATSAADYFLRERITADGGSASAFVVEQAAMEPAPEDPPEPGR
jgi:predicted CXXCH cytochrome family protein